MHDPAPFAAPLASVVVPTCDRPEQLAACLDRLLAELATLPPGTVEIVVGDDGRSDATHALLATRYPGVRWVAGPRRGPAANRNAAAAAASGRYLLFTDDDCLPAPGWITAYLDAIAARPHARVFEGPTVADREPSRLDDEAPLNLTGGHLWSCNMALERQAFLAIGGFCEDFPSAACEDSDLRLRLEKAGESLSFVPAAEVCHPLRPGKGLAFQVRAGRSVLLLHERHPDLLGDRPLARALANVGRYGRALAALAIRYRGRGLGYGIGRLGIYAWFIVLAALRRQRTVVRPPATVAANGRVVP